jgi:hypothetical protein
MPINIAIEEVSQLFEKNFLQIQVYPYIFPSSCQAQDGHIKIYWGLRKSLPVPMLFPYLPSWQGILSQESSP